MDGAAPWHPAATTPTAPASPRSMHRSPAHPRPKGGNASGPEKCSCNASVDAEHWEGHLPLLQQVVVGLQRGVRLLVRVRHADDRRGVLDGVLEQVEVVAEVIH